jgi:hypothetical protein
MPLSWLLYAGKKKMYPLYKQLGGLQGRSGQARKISPTPTKIPSAVANRYALLSWPVKINQALETFPQILWKPYIIDMFILGSSWQRQKHPH